MARGIHFEYDARAGRSAAFLCCSVEVPIGALQQTVRASTVGAPKVMQSGERAAWREFENRSIFLDTPVRYPVKVSIDTLYQRVRGIAAVSAIGLSAKVVQRGQPTAADLVYRSATVSCIHAGCPV